LNHVDNRNQLYKSYTVRIAAVSETLDLIGQINFEACGGYLETEYKLSFVTHDILHSPRVEHYLKVVLNLNDEQKHCCNLCKPMESCANFQIIDLRIQNSHQILELHCMRSLSPGSSHALVVTEKKM